LGIKLGEPVTGKHKYKYLGVGCKAHDLTAVKDIALKSGKVKTE
jgi:hypothetical protein